MPETVYGDVEYASDYSKSQDYNVKKDYANEEKTENDVTVLEK